MEHGRWLAAKKAGLKKIDTTLVYGDELQQQLNLKRSVDHEKCFDTIGVPASRVQEF